MVSFRGEATFDSLFLNFGLRSEIREEQRGLCNGVLLLESERIDERTFRVRGKVPECAAGEYRINEIGSQDIRWEVFFGASVEGEPIKLTLVNENKKAFPNVKEVRPAPDPNE